jgi:hypothetical protein
MDKNGNIKAGVYPNPEMDTNKDKLTTDTVFPVA